MKTTLSRILVTAATVAAAVALMSVMSAGASEKYTSELSDSPRVSQKVAGSSDAAYSPYTSRRKMTKVVRKRTTTAATRRASDLARARTLLAGLTARYPILQGSTVTIGYARGYQAISYYTSGRIIVSPTHSASLDRIMNHEVWHIIDWRDNGRIDWGENVPPRS